MKGYKIDSQGFYLEDFIYEDGQELTDNIVTIDPPQGLYKPKWTGDRWVNGLTQEEIEALQKPTHRQEIEVLKKQLNETDYKIIKCSEYQLAGQELPYDIMTLHTERQALRDRINEIEVALG